MNEETKNKDELNDYEIFSSFDISYKENGVCNKHNTMDIRQFHAINLGFMLTKDEMTLDYFPSENEILPDLPKKYVLIHPVQNWESRTMFVLVAKCAVGDSKYHMENIFISSSGSLWTDFQTAQRYL